MSFLQIPNNIRTPFVAVEFNNVNANQGPAELQYQALLVGQMLSTGTAAANTVVGPITSVAQAITYGGRGSMLERQAIAWFAINPSVPVYLGVLADNAGGVAATGTIVVAGPATAAGTLALYLGGVPVPVGVNSGDASTVIATNIAAAINANPDLPVTASVTSSTVTLTFRHKGLAGNTYDVRTNYNATDALPAGVTATITALGAVVAGTLNPVLTTLIAAAAAMWFQVIAHPYTDATSLTAIENEMARRAGPMVSMDGLAITSASGSFSSAGTLGQGRNSQYSTIIWQDGDTPLTTPTEFAAETAALAAQSAQVDPGLPFQTLAYVNALSPAQTDLFTQAERNTLLFDGIATSVIGAGGVVQIERLITTYQKNGAGAADPSYLDATTIFTLLYLRYSWRTRVQQRYPRVKLAQDGTRFGSGQAVVTPSIMKAEAITWFEDMIDLGLCQDLATFKQNVVVAIDAVNGNQLDVFLPPELIGQLMVTATQIAFLLQ